MKELTGILIHETDKAIKLETETQVLWIPKRAIIDMVSFQEIITVYFYNWVLDGE